VTLLRRAPVQKKRCFEVFLEALGDEPKAVENALKL
jgi:hypothetical protein